MGCCDSKEMPNPHKLEEEVEEEFTTMHQKHNNREVRATSVHEGKTTRPNRPMHARTPSGANRKIKTATALPWKATVLTLFGPGQVTRIARRVDGIAQVTLKKWKLANGSPVFIYAPSFAIKSHHRAISSGASIKGFNA